MSLPNVRRNGNFVEIYALARIDFIFRSIFFEKDFLNPKKSTTFAAQKWNKGHVSHSIPAS